jgi:glycosyltransferase involved in cell wall biosynthesis
MATVVLDASEASAAQPRGWGRYVRGLRDNLDGVEALEGAGRGLELVWEQVGLPRALRRRGADLVHAPNCFLPLRRPCPGVVTVHDLAFEAFPHDFARTTGAKYRFFTPRAVRSAERVICVSAWTAGDLERRYGIDRAKVRVVPNAPSVPLGSAAPPPGPYLLAVGDLRAKKNLGRLVDAFARLHAEGLEHRLVLAGGDAGAEAELRARAGEAPVELVGYAGEAELDALLRGADLLVHPSLYEGFGIVLLEAMARETPVACADATALPETAGGAAELFDPLDVAAIAAAIAAVVGDRERHAALAEAGRRRAEAFSWQRTAAETRAVYEEVL